MVPAAGGGTPIAATVQPGPNEGAPRGVVFIEFTTPAQGDFVVEISVKGDRGSGTARVPIAVNPVNPGVQRLVGALLLVGAGGFAYFYFRRRNSLRT